MKPKISLEEYKIHRNKYVRHRAMAKYRDIPWHFTYVTWWRKWCESGHWHERGRKQGRYVMSRPGDKGPYAPWNVKIILFEENCSEGHLGKKLSKEHRKKISIYVKNNHPFKGKHFSLEHRAKISAAGIGRKHSVNSKKKISVAHKGKKLSDETKAKISVAQTGKRHTEETKAKMSESHKGKKFSIDSRRKMSMAKLDNKNWMNIKRHRGQFVKRRTQ